MAVNASVAARVAAEAVVVILLPLIGAVGAQARRAEAGVGDAVPAFVVDHPSDTEVLLQSFACSGNVILATIVRSTSWLLHQARPRELCSNSSNPDGKAIAIIQPW